jgi:hypothetical protein
MIHVRFEAKWVHLLYFKSKSSSINFRGDLAFVSSLII